MWRRLYFILILVRLYFALSPSYIHPDEHFQGPEVIAGERLQNFHFRSSHLTVTQAKFWAIQSTKPGNLLQPLRFAASFPSGLSTAGP